MSTSARAPSPGAASGVTGASASFDYVLHLEKLIGQVVENVPAFRHVDPQVVLTAWTQARVTGQHGVFATIQPLRFENGAVEGRRNGRRYRWPSVTYGDREILYVIQFLLPRFADLPFRSKLTTIFHELYHISPRCDGDLRRFPGKNYAHGHSREAYNARLQPWIDQFLVNPRSAELTDFLAMDFAGLRQRYRAVTGRRVVPVRPIPVR